MYADPNFFTEKQLSSIPVKFMDGIGGIFTAMVVVTVFEFGFRIAFIIKRKFFPVSAKILEEDIESEIESIAKAHFQKIENKEKELEDKIDRLVKKLKDAEKTSSQNN